MRRSANERRSVTDAAPLLSSYVERDQRDGFVDQAYEFWFGRPRRINGRLVADVLGPAYGQVRRA